MESGLGELLDTRALQAYRQRLRDLGQELAEAEDWSDIGRLDSLRAERDALLQERARVAVNKAISAATGRIATIDGPLGRHLQTRIHTDLNCSYEPDPADDLDWVLDQRPAGT